MKNSISKSNTKYRNNIFIAVFCFAFCLFFFPTSSRAETPTPIFQESFDSLAEVTANGASSHDNLTFEAGKTGNGVRLSGKANLIYPAASRINFQKGTIEFWMKPDWDGSTDLYDTGSGTDSDPTYHRAPRYLLTFFDDNTRWTPSHGLTMSIDAYSPHAGQNLQNQFSSDFAYLGEYSRRNISNEPYSVMTWKPNTWHKVAVYWDFSLPDNSDATHNSYIVTKIDDKYTEQTLVAPAEEGAFGADPKLIFGQDHILGRYPADAVIDDFKIYDHSLLPVQPFPAYKFKTTDPASVAAFRQLFANDGFCSSFENFNNMPDDCAKLNDFINSGQNLLFYQKPALEQVVENTLPKTEEIKNIMSYQAAQGQFEDLFFNAYSRTNLNNVRVTATVFTGPDGVQIPRENLDLRVVKNWFQAGIGTFPDQLPRYVPELLLYNDQVSYDTDPSLTNDLTLPSIPKLDHVETKIDQNTSKQFVAITHIPDSAPAGTYSAIITLTADGVPDQKITLNLEVLPFKLQPTKRKLTLELSQIAYSSQVVNNKDDFYNYYKPYYQDIRDHGFNALHISTNLDKSWYGRFASKLEIFNTRLKLAKDLEFSDVMLYDFLDPNTFLSDLMQPFKDAMVQYGFEPWFYGVDEFCDDHSSPLCFRGGRTNTTMEEYVAKSKVVHSIGGKIADTSSKESFDRLADPSDPLYEPADWSIYTINNGSYYPDLMSGRKEKTPGRLEGYYWQSEDENSWYNRYNVGYKLWNTNLDGILTNYIYTTITFYNDFFWKPDNCCRSNTPEYPSKEGPVPTIEWEAMREGINDLNYLETWKYYKDIVEKTNSNIASDSNAIVKNITDRYADKDLNWTVAPAGFRVSMSQYETDRKTIIAEIKKLQAAAGQQSNTDLNSDSKVDATDFSILKSDFLKLTANLSNPKSDIDGDGQCTVRDAGIMMSGWKP